MSTGSDAAPVVALLTGGGSGPVLVDAVTSLLERAGARIDWQRVELPEANTESLEDAAQTIERCGLALKTKLLGVGQPTVPEIGRRPWSDPRRANPNVMLRLRLDLFAGVRPLRPLPHLPTRHPETDVVLIRESTEDIYKGIEHEIVDGVVQSIKVVTREACERIAEFAFAFATENQRRRVTFVHKANIMKRTDGLFLEVAQATAQRHPELEYRETIVDAACMQLVLDPTQFDVILCGNLYGDLISSLGAGLVGGISAAYGINVGDKVRVFEAIHGSSLHTEGRDQANALPLLLPAIALLRHVGQEAPADRLANAVVKLLEQASVLTPDLGGDATTGRMAEAIARHL